MIPSVPDELDLECSECGARGEAVDLSWDPLEQAWLCGRCGGLLDAIREVEQAECACDGADPRCLMCDAARPWPKPWTED